ncbi:unnamed protein product [Fraxinus pennsylvanica]|uniref:Uncharacterized protein n=1 Tax=Fraxinus pennsylvanica TaxID=56036 RepID=A0AAD2A5N5_9LAMI|nr:unnamed protein product [Fraxinus pennsylvanica]
MILRFYVTLLNFLLVDSKREAGGTRDTPGDIHPINGELQTDNCKELNIEVAEFCNELKKLATRETDSAEDVNGKNAEKHLVDHSRDLDNKEKERKPLLQSSQVDALTTRRGQKRGGVVEGLATQLLIDLDGTDQQKGVYVIGATNSLKLCYFYLCQVNEAAMAALEDKWNSRNEVSDAGHGQSKKHTSSRHWREYLHLFQMYRA